VAKPTYSGGVLRLVRFGLLIIMTFMTLSLVMALASSMTGLIEKVALAAGIVVLLAAAVPVRRIGKTS
jgi:hypothetical protein